MWPLLIFIKLLTRYAEQNYGLYCTETGLEAKSRLYYKICMSFSRLEFVRGGGGGGGGGGGVNRCILMSTWLEAG